MSATTEPTESRVSTLWGRGSLGLLVVLAFLLACNELADYDAWWHLKTGQLIPSKGIPRTDWYSFSSSDRVWIDVHWGFQLLVAAVYWVGRVPGLVLFQATVVAGIVWTMTFARPAGRPVWGVWIVLLVAIIALSGRFNVRPEILSMLFLAVDLALLLHAQARPNLLWGMIPLQCVWANIQSLYVLGPILLAAFVGEAVVGGPARQVGWRRLLTLTVLVGASCLASPYGFQNVLFLLEVFQKIDPNSGEIYRESIGELMPLSTLLSEGGYRAGYVAATLLLALLAAIGIVCQWKAIVLRRELFRLLPILAFGFLGWQSVRNVGHFAVVAGMLSIVNIVPVLPAVRFRRTLFAGSVLVTMLIAGAWVTGLWSLWTMSDRQFGLGMKPYQFSLGAMEVCASPGMPERAAVFHLGHAANFIHACGPEQQILMDPRLEVNSEETYRLYRDLRAAIERGEPAGLEMLDRLRVPLVVADSEQNVGIQATLLSSPLWQCVYWDEVAAVFLRSSYPMPGGVTRFRFDDGIMFSREAGQEVLSRRIPLEGRQATRLLWLAQAMAGRPGTDDNLAETLLWRAVVRASRGSQIDPLPFPSVEQEIARTIAQSYLLLSQHLRARQPKLSDSSGARWVRGWGHFYGRVLLRRSPSELSTALMLAESLADEGALDESIRVLEDLVRRPWSNRRQESVRREVEETLADRRIQLSGRERGPEQPTLSVESFRAFTRAGRGGEFVRFAESQSLEDWLQLNSADRDELASLVNGIDPVASPGGDWIAFSSSMGPWWMTVEGGFSPYSLDDTSSVLLAGTRETLRVTLAALTGDQNVFEEEMSRIALDQLDEADRAWLQHLSDLLLDKANPR